MHDHDHSEQKHIVPTEEMLSDLAELYKIFGDSTRIKILYALFENEKGVGDIAQQLGMTMSAISHQLRILKQGPPSQSPSGGEDGLLRPGR